MSGLNDWKKRAVKDDGQPGQALANTVRRQLAVAAGTEYFENRDPIYHVTEAFINSIDSAGTKRSQIMGSVVPGLTDAAGREAQKSGGDMSAFENRNDEDEQNRLQDYMSMDPMVDPSGYPGCQMFLNKFSNIAFQRGTMAGAVLRGTGKMMLFSCLKRTIGQSQPKNIRQRKLFEGASQVRNVTGKIPDKVMFNRGETDGAVGLVVDALRDARRVVESMCTLASGKNMLPDGSGPETLQKIYPFLSDEKERGLLAQYRGKLSQAIDPQDREVLHHAIIKTEALIEKKEQMKQRFIVALRYVSDKANEALVTFSAPTFTQELYSLLEAEETEQEPPPDDGGDGKDKNAEGSAANAPPYIG